MSVYRLTKTRIAIFTNNFKEVFLNIFVKKEPFFVDKFIPDIN